MTLRTRLGVAGGVVLVVLLAVGVLLPRTVRASQVDEVDRQLRAASPIAIGLASGRGAGALGPPRPAGETPTESPLSGEAPAESPLSDLYVARVDPDDPDDLAGRTVVAQPSATSGREPRAPAPSTNFREPDVETVGSIDGSGSWRAVLVTNPGGTTAIVAVPLDRVDATAQRTTVAILVAAAAVLAAMAAAGWWLLRLGLRPIAEVTQVADAIAGGDRSRRVRGGAPGTEAHHLARAFNVMLDEQAATEAKLRQFVADASHELRTPVAAIGGFADLWREGAVDPDQLDDVMRRIGQESARMRGLVEDLLLLARLDQGRELAVEPVDLAALAADAVLDASATHPSRQVSVYAPEPVVVEGDEARLRQVLANLMSNALVHTDAETTVEVRAERRGDAALLAVSDDGPGMSSDAAARAFDRFWRGDTARARAGAGLGLAIVRGIVAAHDGEVRLDTAPGDGTTVRVVLAASSGSGPAVPARPQETHNQRAGAPEVPA
jgi:two-component system OmpR family sensor kinase